MFYKSCPRRNTRTCHNVQQTIWEPIWRQHAIGSIIPAHSLVDSSTVTRTQYGTSVVHPWSHGNHLSHATQVHFNSSCHNLNQLMRNTSAAITNRSRSKPNRTKSNNSISSAQCCRVTEDYIANVTIFANRVNKHSTAMCWQESLFCNHYVSTRRGLAESSEGGKLSKSSSIR